ncbi:hypothetical protein LXA43DRAFT_1007632 [Ganoderma leucocontextum]|nr:hypothetical protein LXA43DRAFT_1007632 [Ganoderma leucocontextum]
MAKRSRQVSHDSSDDEAPEAVSFGTSKKTAKGEQDAVKQHHAAQKQKRKEKNRAIDLALKDRSTNTKGKGKAVGVGSGKQSKEAEATMPDEEDSSVDDAEEGKSGGPSREELEERMARAMREAEGESGSEEDDEEFEGLEDDVEMDGEDEEMGDEDEEMGSADEDEDDDGEEEDQDGPLTKPSSTSRKGDYLPDHLFKSALSHIGKKIVFDDDAPLLSPKDSPPRKRKRTKRTSKDILLGSRTIRTLSKPTAVAPAAAKGLAPPRRVDKFVKTSLNLKGDAAKAKAKGWNRQPANLGVMKRHGPAAHFVRAS